MEKSFAVTLGGKPVGKVLVNRQGLYMSFHCRCDLKGDEIYRLVVACGGSRQNLGVLIPGEGGFVLQRKVPAKQIGEGDMTFTLTTKQTPVSDVFVPIRPEEPFAYIHRLKESFLTIRDGQPGICIQKMQEC